MGIESFWVSLGGCLFKLSCKKSPQTWGLKEEVKQRKSTHEHGLQKESPDMGIESKVPVVPFQGEDAALQKESPDMGIERDVKLIERPDYTVESTCKKSPQTWGLKVRSPVRRLCSLNLSCKKSPQTWGLKGQDGHPPHPHLRRLQKESPDMGIESPILL